MTYKYVSCLYPVPGFNAFLFFSPRRNEDASRNPNTFWPSCHLPTPYKNTFISPCNLLLTVITKMCFLFFVTAKNGLNQPRLSHYVERRFYFAILIRVAWIKCRSFLFRYKCLLFVCPNLKIDRMFRRSFNLLLFVSVSFS